MRPGSTGAKPTGEERTFGEDEIIVSKTDMRGFITYANDVFCRVSGYSEAELVGRPHNVIRHPDMPRCVFKLLWETIQAGDEIFAYVNTLAKDGASYWVLAHVTPSVGRSGQVVGYHSSRRLPERRALDEVVPLYRRLLEEERRQPGPVEAMAASRRLLDRALEQKNMSYEQMVWDIINRAEARA